MLGVGEADFAVDDVSVGAGGGEVEGPLELAVGQGQAVEGDVAVGARVAQALGLGGEMRGHLREQIGLVEVEVVGQLKLERAAGGVVEA